MEVRHRRNRNVVTKEESLMTTTVANAPFLQELYSPFICHRSVFELKEYNIRRHYERYNDEGCKDLIGVLCKIYSINCLVL